MSDSIISVASEMTGESSTSRTLRPSQALVKSVSSLSSRVEPGADAAPLALL
jgi:hypothetical protein